MKEPVFDIAVIGLGPAGSTPASQLSPDFKVIAFDKKSTEEESFRKPCAGMLSHHGQVSMIC